MFRTHILYKTHNSDSFWNRSFLFYQRDACTIYYLLSFYLMLSKQKKVEAMSSSIIITPAAVSKLAGSAPHLLNRCSRVVPHVLCYAPHRLARCYKVTLMEHANFVWLEHADDSAQLATAVE